jgi:hypothetical protein
LSEARRNIREALSTCEDVLGPDVDAIARDAHFEETMKLSSSTQAAMRSYESAKTLFLKLQARVQEEQAKAARALVRGEGVSLRDAGEFLGLSRERVRKIASDPPKRKVAKKYAHAG